MQVRRLHLLPSSRPSWRLWNRPSAEADPGCSHTGHYLRVPPLHVPMDRGVGTEQAMDAVLYQQDQHSLRLRLPKG